MIKTKTKFNWRRIPETEYCRLEKTLYHHLRAMKVKKTKIERLDLIKIILNRQKYTCAFADGDDSFCWNHPKNKDSDFLVLEWGHKIPRNFGEIAHQLDNLILLCARCNNQIQTSRKIEQLIPELEHKLQALKKLNQS
jgi:hypothetical protein